MTEAICGSNRVQSPWSAPDIASLIRATLATSRAQRGMGPCIAGTTWSELSDSVVKQRQHVRSHSRGAMRPSCASISTLSSNKRAQGKPGARCTRGLVCKNAQKNAHEHTGSAEASGFPCAVVYGLLRALPGEPGSFATVAGGIPPADLAPASGARTTRLRRPRRLRSSLASFASTASHRAFVTIATRPSHRVRRGELIALICPTG
jgi:hypothetical protein